jgi:hypothetical protein
MQFSELDHLGADQLQYLHSDALTAAGDKGVAFNVWELRFCKNSRHLANHLWVVPSEMLDVEIFPFWLVPKDCYLLVKLDV